MIPVLSGAPPPGVRVLTVWAERAAERAEKGRLAGERDQRAAQNERLRRLIRPLQRLPFGRGSERLDRNQRNLGREDREQAVAETAARCRTRFAARAFAAGCGCHRTRGHRLSVVRRHDAGHR